MITKKALGDCEPCCARITAERALVFYCLATYLGFAPQWVRYFGFGGLNHKCVFPKGILDDKAVAGDEAGFGQVNPPEARTCAPISSLQ